MALIEFVIPGKPQPKQRPKFRRAGKFVQTYTPDETQSYEAKVGWLAAKARGDLRPTEKACTLLVEVDICPPSSWSKRKRQSAILGLHHPVSKRPGDWDNLGKVVSDALNGVLWVDDGQVVDGRVVKRFGEIDQVRVIVRELP